MLLQVPWPLHFLLLTQGIPAARVRRRRQTPALPDDIEVVRGLFSTGTGRAHAALLVFIFTLTGCGEGKTPATPTPDLSPTATIDAFLSRHWARPLAAQGPVPAHYGAQESSLAPADCGRCHLEQYRDWQTALHAHAMGPGLLGQLIGMGPDARAEHQDCLRCHAPLAEQADSLSAALIDANPAASTASKVSSLHEQGLICAACHVRAHERFGPPRRDGSAPGQMQRSAMPHNGFTATAAFQDARFCSACHQFQPDEYSLNGKLLENTYEEWKTSRHAREGRSCQSCHMPERRHLWRGIHDADMVRAAIQFVPEESRVVGGKVHAALTVRNTGAGHYFPSYVTPKVTVEIEQIARNGGVLPDTHAERAIQRKVPVDLAREIADTRLPPDGELRLDYVRPMHRDTVALVFRLRVEPDEFYARFYRSLLADSQSGHDKRLLGIALKRAESSGFIAFETRQALVRE